MTKLPENRFSIQCGWWGNVWRLLLLAWGFLFFILKSSRTHWLEFDFFFGNLSLYHLEIVRERKKIHNEFLDR